MHFLGGGFISTVRLRGSFVSLCRSAFSVCRTQNPWGEATAVNLYMPPLDDAMRSLYGQL